MENLIEIKNLSAQRAEKTVFKDINWSLKANENWAIIGKSGSGKTSFIDLIMGKMSVSRGSIIYPSLHTKAMQEKGYFRIADYVAVVRFNISLINYNQFYYQQRYYSSENEGIKTVREFLGETNEQLFNLLKINDLLDLEFIKLSNGQTRKMYLAKALLRYPKVLILDNPFLGLDAEARQTLQNIINKLIFEGYCIIVVCNYNTEIPSGINRVLVVDNFKLTEVSTKSNFVTIIEEHTEGEAFERMFKENIHSVSSIFPKPKPVDFEYAVRMENVVVKYDDKLVLNNINWSVKRGEKWALLGENGSGKSTLLSLIFGDHPQAYANDVFVFDRKRGNGDSIWNIKKRIGYVSPELHLYFTEHIKVIDLITSGVKKHLELAQILLDYYHVRTLEQHDFQRISTGEQRLVLFLKALVQNPDLLILDEPFQGMDKQTIEKSKWLINSYSEGRTVIIVTHYASEIPDSIQNLFLLRDGERLANKMY